jgi:hypothetical protein
MVPASQGRPLDVENGVKPVPFLSDLVDTWHVCALEGNPWWTRGAQQGATGHLSSPTSVSNCEIPRRAGSLKGDSVAAWLFRADEICPGITSDQSGILKHESGDGLETPAPGAICAAAAAG